MVIPNSHKRTWNYEYVNKGGYLKPEIREDVSSIGAALLNTEPGSLVIFNENLLHRGAVNHGSTTRVSAEITMVFDQS